ncbi:MAG: ZIP family metal transporter [Lachnospiraceae bacterium]|nr:ZIP family metal transporter [Lachnospiraceae bacterium]
MWLGIMIPFIGTVLGAACVFFMKGDMKPSVQKILSGFAAGVMVAASVWSLLIPSMEMVEDMGRLSFLPASVGFILGIAFLLLLDRIIPHLHVNEAQPEGIKAQLKKSSMLVLAVTLHNIPEGMAVGAVFAGMIADNGTITMMGALALSIGIAIQNMPEGAIISMPVCSSGAGKKKAFFYGLLSGVVEPVGALITIWLSGFILPFLPYLLAFAAGAMIYVVVEELIPEAVEGSHSNIGTISFSVGFVLMMMLDVALG